MGLFSFHTADTNRVIEVAGRGSSFPVAFLIPKEFGGGKIVERHYDGYGHFGYEEAFELLAEWNLDYLSEDLLKVPVKEEYSREWFYTAAVERRNKLCLCLQELKTNGASFMKKKYGKEWKRDLIINFYFELQERQERLKYPLKIVENLNLSYEEVEGESRDCDNCLL